MYKSFMDINQVHFIGSFPDEKSCPESSLPEYAFIGRSNVGKSSLINMILGRKELAFTSKKPGKTQLINLFKINERWMIADLPGYGYAKVSKVKRKAFEKMIDRYLLLRPNLVNAFVLIDIRHPLQEIDLNFINELGEKRIPFTIIYTKADKLKNAQIDEHVGIIRNALLEHWEELPPDIVTSSTRKTGRDEILQFISDLNEEYYLTAESLH